MNYKQQKIIGLFSTLLVMAALILTFYGKIALSPNKFLFAVSGDGLTNYYTFAYHLKNDKNYTDFGGMNYPYGESLLMTDAQPVICNILKYFSNHVSDISDFSVGIMNMLMLLSLLFAAIFLYLILLEFGIPVYVAVAGASSISMLSSQPLLWEFGHYALSYTVFFPLTWYLYLKYLNGRHTEIYSVLLLLNALFWFYTHVYLGMIAVCFTFFSQLFYFVFTLKNNFSNVSFYVETFVQSLLPLVFVWAGISVFDHHIGRIEMPFHHHYKAGIYSVLLPNYGWSKELLERFIDFTQIEIQPWTQIGNYIGLSTILSFVVALIYAIIKLISGNFRSVRNLLPPSGLPALLSSIVLLLFAMALPFRYMDSNDVPPLIRQFVSMGRFAWVFYYVITVFGLYVLLKSAKGRMTGMILIFSCLLIFSEGYAYHKKLSQVIAENKSVFRPGKGYPLPDEVYDKLLSGSFQAMLPIPFYHGYICLHQYKGTISSVILSEAISYHTGIPMFAASLPRASVYESQKIASLFLPPYYRKSIIDELPDQKILVTYTGEEITDLEINVLKKSEYLFSHKNFEFYALNPKDLKRFNPAMELEEFRMCEDSLVLDSIKGLYTAFSHAPFLYYNGFDNLQSDKKYRGNGSLKFDKRKINCILSLRTKKIPADMEFELSFWYYNVLYDQSFNTVCFEVRDRNDTVIESRCFDPMKSYIYDGDWAFHKINFKLSPEADRILLISQGSDFYSKEVYFDELLIRPKAWNVYDHVFGDIVVKNNENIPRYE